MRTKLRTVGDLIDRLAGATEAQLEHITRRASALPPRSAGAWGLALDVLKMRAALKAAEEGPETASESRSKGGRDMNEKPLTGSSRLVLDTIHGYARHHRQQGESMEEAVARACSEQPSLYRQYDDARRREAAEHAPPVRPKKAKAVEPQDLTAEKAALETGLRAAAEAVGMDYLTYCTEHPEGKERYRVLDAMITRGMSREKADEFTAGKE